MQNFELYKLINYGMYYQMKEWHSLKISINLYI